MKKVAIFLIFIFLPLLTFSETFHGLGDIGLGVGFDNGNMGIAFEFGAILENVFAPHLGLGFFDYVIYGYEEAYGMQLAYVDLLMAVALEIKFADNIEKHKKAFVELGLGFPVVSTSFSDISGGILAQVGLVGVINKIEFGFRGLMPISAGDVGAVVLFAGYNF